MSHYLIWVLLIPFSNSLKSLLGCSLEVTEWFLQNIHVLNLFSKYYLLALTGTWLSSSIKISSPPFKVVAILSPQPLSPLSIWVKRIFPCSSLPIPNHYPSLLLKINCMEGVVGWIMYTNRYQALIPRTWKCYLIRKKSHCHCKLRILIWRDYLWWLKWAVNWTTRVPYKREAKGNWTHRSKERHVKMKTETGVIWPQAKVCGSHKKLEKEGRGYCSRASEERLIWLLAWKVVDNDLR